MNISFLLIVTLTLVIGSKEIVWAQEGIPASSFRLIDSALSIMDMSRSDCTLRWDGVTPDAFRLPIIKEVFEQPFKTFSYTRYHATHLRELDANTADVYFQRLLKDLQLGTYRPVVFSGEKNAEEIQTLLKTKKPAPGGVNIIDRFTILPLFKQYILPLIETVNAVNTARAAQVRNPILVAQCDSLNMMSHDDENGDIYQLKAAEKAGDSVVKAFFEQAALCDMQQLYVYSLSLYRHYLGVVSSSRNMQELLRDSLQTTIIETAYGRIAFGGAGDDTYNGDYLFILDIGGNDKYYPSATKAEALARPVRVILDLSGDDVYVGSSYTLGSGLFGCGIVLDVEGNDSYKAGSFSLGSGLFGVGIVHDLKGMDSYQGAVFSQGAGCFGIGLLIDNSGNDQYSVQAFGQAIGRTKGFGALCDKSGNDVYATVSPFVDDLRYDSHYLSFTQGVGYGYRATASGGVGVLYDVQGNDTYISDIFGQGIAYWFGIGALIDDEGEDRYQSYQYAQGSGVHFAHAILWDKKGDDVYVSHGVSQGCGHDVGFGMLLDERGDDSYLVESLSLGGGNVNALSILCDERGDDSYIARNTSNTMGFSDFRRNYGMVGIFADGGGNDFYGESTRNNSTSTKSTYGVFLDIPSIAAEQQTEQEKKAEPPYSSGKTVERLFIQASAAAVKHQYMVNPARDEIVKMGKQALPFIASKLSDEGARERLALEYLLPKLYEKDTVAMRQLLLDSLRSANYFTIGITLWAVGKCGVKESAPRMEELLLHTDWRIRAAAAQQIGEAKLRESAKQCAVLLNDSVPLVRARAAYTIAQLLSEEMPELLQIALKDSTQLVRNSTAMGLKATVPVKSSVYALLVSECKSLRGLRSLMRSISSVDTAGDNSRIISMLPQLDVSIRETAYRTIIESKSNYWKTVLDGWKSREPDAALLKLLGGVGLPQPSVAPAPQQAKPAVPKQTKSPTQSKKRP